MPDGWLDLRREITSSNSSDAVGNGWILTVGWPFDTPASETLEEFAISLPSAFAIIECAPGVFLRMKADSNIEINDLAELISTMLMRFYQINDDVSVELALEEE